MGVVLAVAGWGLVLLLATLVLVIVTPLHLRGEVSSTPPRLRVVIAPLGGLIPIRLPLEGGRGTPKRQKKKRRSRERGRRDARRALPEVPALLSGVIGALQVEYLRVDARFGLEDPADTGTVFGLLAPVLYAVPQGPQVAVAVAPEFGGPAISGSAEGAISVTLAKMFPPALRFGWRVFGPSA